MVVWKMKVQFVADCVKRRRRQSVFAAFLSPYGFQGDSG